MAVDNQTMRTVIHAYIVMRNCKASSFYRYIVIIVIIVIIIKPYHSVIITDYIMISCFLDWSCGAIRTNKHYNIDDVEYIFTEHLVCLSIHNIFCDSKVKCKIIYSFASFLYTVSSSETAISHLF